MEYGELIMDKESIRDALNKASSMYPYEVVGKPETYSQYNAGWQDAIDYLSQLLGVDIDQNNNFALIKINGRKEISLMDFTNKGHLVYMTTASDVSKYIVEYAYDNGSSVSNLQLQKILYFLWIDFYKEYRE